MAVVIGLAVHVPLPLASEVRINPDVVEVPNRKDVTVQLCNDVAPVATVIALPVPVCEMLTAATPTVVLALTDNTVAVAFAAPETCSATVEVFGAAMVAKATCNPPLAVNVALEEPDNVVVPE